MIGRLSVHGRTSGGLRNRGRCLEAVCRRIFRKLRLRRGFLLLFPLYPKAVIDAYSGHAHENHGDPQHGGIILCEQQKANSDVNGGHAGESDALPPVYPRNFRNRCRRDQGSHQRVCPDPSRGRVLKISGGVSDERHAEKNGHQKKLGFDEQILLPAGKKHEHTNQREDAESEAAAVVRKPGTHGEAEEAVPEEVARRR